MKKFELRVKKFKNILKYLSIVKDPSQIVQDKLGYDNLLSLKQLLEDETFLAQNTDWSDLYQLTIDQIFVNLIVFLAETCDQLKIKNFIYNEALPSDKLSPNDRSISILVCLFQILHYLTQIQFLNNDLLKFNNKMFENKLVDALLSFMEHESFLNQYSRDLDTHYLIVSSLKIMKNFTENQNLNKQIWSELNIEQKLKDFSQKCRCESLYNKEMNEIIENLNTKTVENCLKHLKELNEPNRIIEDNKAYAYFLFLFKQVQQPGFDKHDILATDDSSSLFLKLLDNLYSYRDQLEFEDLIIEVVFPKKSLSNNEKKVSILFYLINIVNSIFDSKLKMKQIVKTAENEPFKIYLKFLQDETFILKSRLCSVDFVSNFLYLVNSCKKYADDDKKTWKYLNVFEILLNLSKVLLKVSKNKLNKQVFMCYWILCFIISEDQIDQAQFVKVIIEHLFKSLSSSQASLFNLKVSNSSALECLRRMSLNHTIKDLVYENIQVLREILHRKDKTENENEKVLALRLLIQLCFNKDILDDLLFDNELQEYLEVLCKTSSVKNNLAQLAESILLLLNPVGISGALTTNQKDVMISFVNSDRVLFNRLKDGLEKNGFGVKTSRSDIPSSLFVIICVNEKYRLNEFCQIEARKAQELGKELVFLITQDGCENIDGWLGQILRDKFKISLIENTFEQAFKILMDHLKAREDLIKIIEDPQLEETNIKSENTEMQVKTWTEERVLDWFKRNKIHSSIIKAYGSINGKTLAEIYKIKNKSVDFFYERLLIETNNELKLTDIALFTLSLDSLFQVDDNPQDIEY